MSRLSLAAVLVLLVVLAAPAEAEIWSSSQYLVVTASANLKTSPPVSPVVEVPLASASDEAEVRANDLARLEPPTPAIWKLVKSFAYEKLPRHRQEGFEAVWVGMAVSTADETIPGVGLQGVWW